MRQTNFEATEEVYGCVSGCVVERQRLTHADFGSYCLSLTRLLRSLGENGADEVWKAILRPLQRYRFALCAAPLSFNDPSVQIVDVAKLRASREALALVYPSPALQLENVIDTLEQVLKSGENPYSRWLTAEIRRRPSRRAALLIRDSRLVGPTEHSLARELATRWITVVTPAQLSRERCFEVLYVLGAGRWFPQFIFNSPRAEHIALARYAWIRDRMDHPITLVASSLPALDVEEDPPDDTYCDAGELLPVIDWRAIGQRAGASEIENPLEAVEARAVLLEGDCAVFLEATDGSSVLTIDLEADESTERIARIPTMDVRAGTFVLLRTSGGGDYIVTEADRNFLKTRAPELREVQRRWKTLLRKEVEKAGLFEICLRLIDLGSSSADEMNVRNYLSPRSIRTRDPRDFEAVMKLIGLGESWEEYWNMMGEIDRAHRQAGRQIRRQLLHRLSELNLVELERVGRMEITLAHEGTGSFTAFRVVEVAPETQRVSLSRLAHPFEV